MRRHLTYSNVIATVALFIALGGSSYAAIQLSKGDVKRKHIAKDAVNSKKIEDGSLLSNDFKAGQLVAGAPGRRERRGRRGCRASPSRRPAVC